ncbi:TetR/AcrR family transcriptional regulator [Oceanobacillus chungangensis]|uniref:TetR/AcrR family transcriptional regulator n=1 Tax=Oceanobacillus chungangensis TaxID=1229152 RepID=A0A3D8PUP2_9BACI|nr:TetR/AcrR family transcriptional regulator [Oceanobacillus chungangensis]RDW18879.1 TetR/AcrR family transcriptional regulator [Oceanobacillus chungangensis]
MKSIEIKDAALKYFTIHGYEGASLSQIAKDVGLKKQSIYAHFKGKDDLFLQVLRDAKEMDLSSTVQYFSSVDSKNPEKALYGYLQLVIDLFQKDEQLKFWLRMSFFPPAHLEKVIEREVTDIEEKERAILEGKFQEWINAKLIIGDAAITPTFAFLSVVDSVLVELVYGNDEEKLKAKLAAAWTVFWRGISHQ